VGGGAVVVCGREGKVGGGCERELLEVGSKNVERD
jgi:hypothetical protein